LECPVAGNIEDEEWDREQLEVIDKVERMFFRESARSHRAVMHGHARQKFCAPLMRLGFGGFHLFCFWILTLHEMVKVLITLLPQRLQD
jgi:hypothetical protein